MAWFRRMGVDEVAYHQATVVGRGDDHPGQALDYYGTRGETPLRWGGAGAEFDVGYLEHQDRTRSTWLDEHPDLRQRIAAINRELDPTPTIQERLQALEVKRPDHGIGLEL